MVAAVAEQFNQQREQILAHLDPSRIGKSYTKAGKQLTYSRKEWLDDLIDWAAASESLSEAIQTIVFATFVQAARDATQALGVEAGWFDPFTPAITDYFEN